jgi:glutamyl-tRNA synthetase
MGKALAAAVLDAAFAGAAAAPTWDADAAREVVTDAAVTAGLVNAEGRPQLAKSQGPVRVAVLGRSKGLPLFESLAVLGRDETVRRLEAARQRLGPAPVDT